jgi:N-acetylmuramoyl-L-alanine amidase
MRLLRRGDRDVAIGEIRARLAHMGFTVDCEETNYFDERLDTAVRAFQSARGLTPDGIIGPLTLATLEEALWSLGDRTLSFAPGNLMQGDDVVSLQQRLVTLGFDCGKVDGIFGQRTDSALREFQRSVGLVEDGIAATLTFEAFHRLRKTVSGGRSEKLRQSVVLDAMRTGIANKTFAIDAEIGGHNEELVKLVANKLQGRLTALGATVALTHPLMQPSAASEAERADLCNKIKADLVLSIQCNRESAELVFHFGSEHSGWSHTGQRAAMRIKNAVSQVTDSEFLIAARTWEILRLTKMPSIIINLNGITEDNLKDKSYLENFVTGIATGVSVFFEPVS